jgi:hypothetical protein
LVLCHACGAEAREGSRLGRYFGSSVMFQGVRPTGPTVSRLANLTAVQKVMSNEVEARLIDMGKSRWTTRSKSRLRNPVAQTHPKPRAEPGLSEGSQKVTKMAFLSQLFGFGRPGIPPPTVTDSFDYTPKPTRPSGPRRDIPYSSTRNYADASTQTDSSLQSRSTTTVMTDPLPFSLDLFEEPEDVPMPTLPPPSVKFPSQYGRQPSSSAQSSFTFRPPPSAGPPIPSRPTKFVFRGSGAAAPPGTTRSATETQSSSGETPGTATGTTSGLVTQTETDYSS